MSRSSIAAEAEDETSIRTMSPKRRLRSSSCTASSRSSASSETSKSASLVSRKTTGSLISICGKSAARKWAITSSSGMNSPLAPTSKNRGSPSGTFTRASRSSPVSGSRTNTARLSDSAEMYGNGWPGPTAKGVSTG